jgi:pimeloyl-ACP methyl ester carboxylesterase
MRRLTGALVLIALALPASAHAGRFTVTGGTAATLTTCGKAHALTLLDGGGTAAIRVVGPGRRKRAHIVLQRCRDGKWIAARRVGKRRASVTEHVGDFRVRLVGRRHARAAFLRFGVGEIVDTPFTVAVKNVNGTAVPCMADGGDRTLHGHLTSPRSLLSKENPAVALYLHGFAVDETFWRFRAVPGYDTTTTLAEAGHASVTIDRAGYSSSRTDGDGNTTCIGSHADMAHQVVAALKSGDYTVEHNEPVKFARAALIGHSVGGLIAELAGASFDGIDGIGIISYADQGQTPLAVTELGDQSLRCGSGGDKATPGYALFGATDAAFAAAFLNAPTDPAVLAAELKMHVPEPCGDVLSAAATLVISNAIGGTLTGPVLLISGEDDALFTPTGVMLQGEKLFATNDTVTTELIADTGHALTIGLSAPTVVNALEGWLSTNDF